MGSSRDARATRAVRGVAAAAFATFVAVLSHSAAQGESAPLLGILLAFTVAAPVCVLLAGRTLSWTRLSIAVLLSQIAFHGLLSIGVGGATRTVMSPLMEHAGHVGVLAASTAGHDMTAHTDGWMWAAHALAAVLTVLAFGRGEQALRTLLRLVARRLVAWRPIALPAPVRAPRLVSFGRLLIDPGFVLLSTMRRRGPPLAA